MLIPVLLLVAVPFLHAEKTECYSSQQVLWSEEVSDGPFAAPAVLLDLTGTGRLHAVMASFDGRVHALDTVTGQSLEGWPVAIPHSSIHAKPIPFDIDRNGQLDILIVTSQAEIVALKPSGETLLTAELDPLLIRKDWSEQSIASDRDDVHTFILDDPASVDNTNYVAVDPHVLADPLLFDVNGDGVVEELVLVVSYYLDENDYPQVQSTQGVARTNWDRYLASAVLLYNLTSMEAYKTFHLELTTRDLAFPGYVFGSALLVDLEGTGRVDIVVGSSTSRLHVMDIAGKPREGFPAITDSIHTDISAADVNGDGKLELIFVDRTGTVHCIDASGDVVWQAEIQGDFFSKVQVVDLTDSAVGVEVVLSSDTGYIHVLRGTDGRALSNWPQKVGGFAESSPLVTQLCGRAEKSVMVLAADGHLHLMSGQGDCKQTINLGETSFVDLTVVQSDSTQGILVLTKDGTVMCLQESDGRDCSYGRSATSPQIQIHLPNVSYVTGADFQLPYSVTAEPPRDYILKVYFANRPLIKKHITVAEMEKGNFAVPLPPRSLIEGIFTVPSPARPMSGHLQVILCDKHGQVAAVTMYVHFNTQWKEDVKFVFVFPVLMLSGLLLFGFGFQAAELLPFTHQSKEL